MPISFVPPRDRPTPRRRPIAPLIAALVAWLATAPPLAAQRAKSSAKSRSAKTSTKRSAKGPAKSSAKSAPKRSSTATARGVARPAAAGVAGAAAVAAARPDSVLRGFQVDTLAEPIPETLAPRYPRELRSREVRGSVIAEFVVDTAGHVEPATFRVISSDDPAFTASVRELLPRARFLPAINEGRVVRQIVRQTFVFDLDVLQKPGTGGAAPQ